MIAKNMGVASFDNTSRDRFMPAVKTYSQSFLLFLFSEIYIISNITAKIEYANIWSNETIHGYSPPYNPLYRIANGLCNS